HRWRTAADVVAAEREPNRPDAPEAAEVAAKPGGRNPVPGRIREGRRVVASVAVAVPCLIDVGIAHQRVGGQEPPLRRIIEATAHVDEPLVVVLDPSEADPRLEPRAGPGAAVGVDARAERLVVDAL